MNCPFAIQRPLTISRRINHSCPYLVLSFTTKIKWFASKIFKHHQFSSWPIQLNDQQFLRSFAYVHQLYACICVKQEHFAVMRNHYVMKTFTRVDTDVACRLMWSTNWDEFFFLLTLFYNTFVFYCMSVCCLVVLRTGKGSIIMLNAATLKCMTEWCPNTPLIGDFDPCGERYKAVYGKTIPSSQLRRQKK